MNKSALPAFLLILLAISILTSADANAEQNSGDTAAMDFFSEVNKRAMELDQSGSGQVFEEIDSGDLPFEDYNQPPDLSGSQIADPNQKPPSHPICPGKVGSLTLDLAYDIRETSGMKFIECSYAETRYVAGYYQIYKLASFSVAWAEDQSVNEGIKGQLCMPSYIGWDEWSDNGRAASVTDVYLHDDLTGIKDELKTKIKEGLGNAEARAISCSGESSVESVPSSGDSDFPEPELFGETDASELDTLDDIEDLSEIEDNLPLYDDSDWVKDCESISMVPYDLIGVSGKVFILRGGGTKWKPAKNNMAIFEGDRIMTEGDGHVEIVFGGSSRIRLSPRTYLHLPCSNQVKKSVLERGAINIWENIKRIARNEPYDPSNELGAGHSISSRKGTDYIIEVDEKTQVATYTVNEGIVEVWLKNDPSTKRELRAGESAQVTENLIQNHAYEWESLLEKYDWTDRDLSDPPETISSTTSNLWRYILLIIISFAVILILQRKKSTHVVEHQKAQGNFGFGKVSLIIGLVMAVLFLALFVLVGMMDASVAGGIPDDAPVLETIGVLVILGVGACTIGAALGIISLLRKNQKKIWAALGLILNVIIIIVIAVLILLSA